jgi:hypothetical protein
MDFRKDGWPKRIPKKFKSKLISAHMGAEDGMECPVRMTFHHCGHISFVADKRFAYGERHHSDFPCPVCKEDGEQG